MPDISDRDHAELLLLYQVTIDDIEKTKQWGWTVAYATVAAQGAVLGLSIAYRSVLVFWLERSLLMGLVFAFSLVARNQIRHSQAGLVGFRARIKKIRSSFGEPFQSCFGDPNPKHQWPLEPVVWVATAIIVILIGIACGA